MYVKTTCYTC